MWFQFCCDTQHLTKSYHMICIIGNVLYNYSTVNVYCIYSFIFIMTSLPSIFLMCRLTREDFACATSNGHQVLNQVLAVGGLATARLPQKHDGLILAGGEQAAVGRLGHRIDMRSRVLTSTTFEHVHYLVGGGHRRYIGRTQMKDKDNISEVCHMKFIIMLPI